MSRPALPYLALAGVLGACSGPDPVFHPLDDPARLSDWNLFEREAGALRPKDAVMAFRPANQLFSDYAQKLRTAWMPAGARARLRGGKLDWPVGTVLSKTFYYPLDGAGAPARRDDAMERAVDLAAARVLETRLLVRRAGGWEALPYVWNDEQTEAFLRVAGAGRRLRLAGDERDFAYFVPNRNQCAGCHQRTHPDGGLEPLGAVAAQLAGAFGHPGPGPSQLEELAGRGWLEAAPAPPVPAAWRDPAASVEERALAYLNMNCGHCHNPDGPADTSALTLDGSHRSPLALGVCKPPVAAGGGAGDMRYGIVPGRPERSILLHRMESTEPDAMMPELGRSLAHREGVELVRRWIARMPGACRSP